ncbi:MAG: TolC family protein, partial [Lentisphaerae bacterium]|nr:TolC family protein [Lentisphaerota bacterium]
CEALRKAARAARDAVALAQNQYTNGLADFNGVLDAQRSLLTFEETVTLSEGAISEHLICVYKALGGGWSALPAPEPEEAGR